jgi:membrane protease YdiL (CAAX protease family)
MSDTTKRILLFLGITFIVAYVLEIAVMGISAVGVVIFIPLAAMIVTRIATGEGFEDMWIKPQFKSNLRYYIMAWILPVLFILVGTVLYFVLFPAKFDQNLGYMAELYKAQGVEADAATLQGIMSTQLIVALFISPLINTVSCAFEEWGWRGYLLPKLTEKMKPIWAVLLTGLISGLWYLPLVVMGYNYGTAYAGFPYWGIIAMCLFIAVIGVFLSYITYRTRSFLPAALARGAINAFASVGLYYLYSSAEIDVFLGPAPTGIIGGAAFIIAATVFAVLIIKKTKKGTLIRPLDEA